VYEELDGVALNFVARPVDVALEVRTAADHAGPLQKHVQEREFPCAQLLHDIPTPHLPRCRVEPPVPVGQRARVPRPALHHHVQPREQLLHDEGLHDVVVGAEIEAAHARIDFVPRGKDHDRYVAAVAAHAREKVEAVAVGQAQVEQHGVRRAAREGAARGGGIGDPFGHAIGIFERHAQGRADHGVIFDQEDAHRPSITPPQDLAET